MAAKKKVKKTVKKVVKKQLTPKQKRFFDTTPGFLSDSDRKFEAKRRAMAMRPTSNDSTRDRIKRNKKANDEKMADLDKISRMSRTKIRELMERVENKREDDKIKLKNAKSAHASKRKRQKKAEEVDSKRKVIVRTKNGFKIKR